MPKKRIVTFKNPESVLICRGQQIHVGNITPEKYDELIELAPGHADYFNVVEVEEEPEKKTKNETAQPGE